MREPLAHRLGKKRKAGALAQFLFLGGEHTGKDIFTRARDTDTASLIFGPSKRTEGDWRPLAKGQTYWGQGRHIAVEEGSG